MDDVHAFAYRLPRFPLTLPVAFCVEGYVIRGHTKNLSENGSLVRLAEPTVVGTQGRLRLRIDSCVIELAAEVTYAELYEAGLNFHFVSDAERSFVESLLRVVARSKDQDL